MGSWFSFRERIPMLDPKKAEVAMKRHFARVTPEEFRKRAASASHGDTEGKPAKPAAPAVGGAVPAGRPRRVAHG